MHRHQLHLLVVIVYLHLLARVQISDETLGAFRDGTTLFVGMNFWSLMTKVQFLQVYHFYKELFLSTNTVFLNPGGSLLFKNMEAEYWKTCFKYNLMSAVPSARWN